jgi:protein required for attachment to host cells
LNHLVEVAVEADMTTTWIVAADSSRARVLQVLDREQKLQEVQSLSNPGGRAHERDLQTDAEPRWNGHGGKAGSGRNGGPANDREAQGPNEHAMRTFAREIGHFLEKARTEKRYDELVLVAPPKVLGALRGELEKEVQKLVADDMPKNLSWLSERELEGYFARREGSPAKGSAPGR